MPTGYPITDDDKLRVIEMFDNGLSRREVIKKSDLSPASVDRIKKEFYGKDIRSMDVTIAGDKKHGTLRSVGPSHYIGTCFLENGKSISKRFNVSTGSKDAIKLWSEWQQSCWKKAEQREESQRKDIPVNQVKVTTSAPVSNASIISNTMTEKPKTVLNSLYILVVGDPKVAGWFVDMEQAIKAEDIANKALECAGVDARYQVLEVKRWK